MENNLLRCIYRGGMHNVTVVALRKPQILLCYQSSRYRALIFYISAFWKRCGTDEAGILCIFPPTLSKIAIV